MVTFKQFIAEGEADLVMALKKPISKAVGVPTYKVDIHKMSTQEVDGHLQLVLRLSIPTDIESDFYSSMVQKLLRRELAKVAPEGKITGVQISPWTGASGQKIDTVYVYFQVPHAALNSQP